jgi:hypothetical protein
MKYSNISLHVDDGVHHAAAKALLGNYPLRFEKEKALGVTDHMARDSSVPTFSIDKIQANRTGRWKHDEKRLFSQVKTILF